MWCKDWFASYPGPTIRLGPPTFLSLKAQINYETVLTAKGAEAKIASANAEAVSAIHQFLKFQIKDHQTGDSTEVSN